MILTRKNVEDLRDAFIFMDYNKDGKINNIDVAMLIRSIGLCCSNSEIHNIVQHISKNFNGEIDLENLTLLITEKMVQTPKLNVDSLQKIFQNLENSLKPFANQSKLRHLLKSIGLRLTDKEIDTLFKKTNCLSKDGEKINYIDLIEKVKM
ncbi:hypothetical protein A3Q56_01879 [Intoshia linei]|uniref:EF-hand domain-containing protein n=1 Tax=Intoshia linei TaxID=1819745 RepID=A0A177B9X8_9BILA|nr:hypothetical protein A3Q56_01879 [Intoshia linei]